MVSEKIETNYVSLTILDMTQYSVALKEKDKQNIEICLKRKYREWISGNTKIKELVAQNSHVWSTYTKKEFQKFV
jgi:hypothetical protein